MGRQPWGVVSVYAVAANAIHIHVEDSEEESENKEIVSSTRALATATKKTLAMTQTGILSNRRPHGDRQGASTDLFRPSGGGGGVGGDLLVLAKREAARRELYSRFHRGGVVHAREVAGFPGRIDPKTDGDETGEKWEPPPSVDGERADVGKESRRAEKRRRKEGHTRRKGDRKKAKRGA